MAKITAAMIATVMSIAGAAEGFVMLTQAEGAEVVKAGLATVDQSKAEGDKAAVSLTEAGVKLAAEQPTEATSTTSASSSYEIEDGVALPTSTTRRGREGGYPFEKLEIGQSFHVAKSDKNPNPVSRLASSVSGARVRFSEKTGEMENATVKTYAKNADGSYTKDADGKRVVESTATESREKLRLTRDFVCKAVGAEDPKGEGARVWRVALATDNAQA